MVFPRGPALAVLLAVAFLGGRGAAEYESIVSGCPLRPPPGMWPAAAAFEGADATASNVMPAATAGSCAQSALRLDGLCSPDSFPSSAFRRTRGASGAWTVEVVGRSDASLALGLEHCELGGLSVAREDSARGRLTLRLQFGRCDGGVSASGLGLPPGRDAAVEVDLHEARDCGSNLLPWMCQLSAEARALGACLGPPPPGGPETTRPPGEVSLSVHAQWREVGAGRCVGTGLEEEPLPDPASGGPARRAECRNACVESLAKFQLSGGTSGHDRCRGFAYSPRALGSRCILYRSPSVDITGSEGLGTDSTLGGWSCWAFDILEGSFAHHAPGAGAGAAADSEEREALAERLQLFPGGAAAPTSAVQRRLEPPAQMPDCYRGVDWYTLESSPGVRASICVREGDLARLQDLVPPKPAGCCTRAPGQLTVDRVCVVTCGSDRGGCLHQKGEAVTVDDDPGANRLSLLSSGGSGSSVLNSGGMGCPECGPSRLGAGIIGAIVGASVTGFLIASFCGPGCGPNCDPGCGSCFWRKRDGQKRFRLVMHEYDNYGRGNLVKDLGEGQTYSWEYEQPSPRRPPGGISC